MHSNEFSWFEGKTLVVTTAGASEYYAGATIDIRCHMDALLCSRYKKQFL